MAVGQALLTGVVSNALGGNARPDASLEDIARDGLLNALGLGEQETDENAATPEGEQQAEPEEVDPAEALLRGLLSRGRQREETEEPQGDDNNR